MSVIFRDRVEAGRVLAEDLAEYRGTNPVVLAIPRGGVPVAAEVARELDGVLDIVVARKLGAPGAPEYAIGAVTANGGRFLNDRIIRELRVSPGYLDAVTATERAEAQRQEGRLRGVRPRVPLDGRVVILIDDGLATGATMRAAVRSLKEQHPGRLIVAVPVGAPSACAVLRAEVDEVVCPYEPELFRAVGFFYEDFAPVEDAVVRRLLVEARAQEVAGRSAR
jgi:predicted phosphoribosyltransferase